jgi:hypothetical protein
MTLGAENIGPNGRRQRVIMAAIALLVGLAGFAFLRTLGAPRVSRLCLFLPFWFAGLGWFQAQGRT